MIGRHIGIVVALTLAGSAWAEQPDGALLFAEACAGCHGGDGRGGGTFAVAQGLDLPDLTTFAARAEGRFDAVRLAQIIDGREGLAAHGAAMPLLGGQLTGPATIVTGPDGATATTTERVAAIVAHLETLQREREE